MVIESNKMVVLEVANELVVYLCICRGVRRESFSLGNYHRAFIYVHRFQNVAMQYTGKSFVRVYMYANMFRCFINVVMVGLSPRASIALPPNLHLINDSTCLSVIHKHKLTLYFSLVSSSIYTEYATHEIAWQLVFLCWAGIGYRLVGVQ